MKLFGVFAFFLMMSPVAILNAQTSNATHCATVSAGADCDPIGAMQRKLGHTNRNVNRLQSQVAGLKKQQTQQGKTIADAEQQRAIDRGDLDNTKHAVNNQGSRVSALEDRVSNLSKTTQIVIFMLALALFICAAYLVWWLRGLKRNHRKDLEYLEDRLIAKEVVIINPNRAYLQAMWKSSEGQPWEKRIIRFTERLIADPAKERTLGGDVSGYTAIFESDIDVENQYPIIRHNGGPVIRIDKVAKHASNILGLTQPQDPLVQ